jgi:hypothetical protein
MHKRHRSPAHDLTVLKEAIRLSSFHLAKQQRHEFCHAIAHNETQHG